MNRMETEARKLELAIAKRIREYRKNLEWTLEDLSKNIGLSPGYLSQIENGDKTPPISTLTKIGYGLGITASTLITGETVEDESGKISIGKLEKRIPVERLEAATDSLIQSFGFAKPDRVMDTYVLTLGADFPIKAAIHTGQEFVYTLEGRHKFYYDGKTYTLNSGDAIYFESNRPHMGCRLGKDAAKILVVSCGASQSL
jgi:transcriptional regulator with XRE-family HTH domain